MIIALNKITHLSAYRTFYYHSHTTVLAKKWMIKYEAVIPILYDWCFLTVMSSSSCWEIESLPSSVDETQEAEGACIHTMNTLQCMYVCIVTSAFSYKLTFHSILTSLTTTLCWLWNLTCVSPLACLSPLIFRPALYSLSYHFLSPNCSRLSI